MCSALLVVPSNMQSRQVSNYPQQIMGDSGTVSNRGLYQSEIKYSNDRDTLSDT